MMSTWGSCLFSEPHTTLLLNLFHHVSHHDPVIIGDCCIEVEGDLSIVPSKPGLI